MALIRRFTALVREEDGMATAEYAMGTVAATSFAGILIWILKQDWVREALINIIKAIFNI